MMQWATKNCGMHPYGKQQEGREVGGSKWAFIVSIEPLFWFSLGQCIASIVVTRNGQHGLSPETQRMQQGL